MDTFNQAGIVVASLLVMGGMAWASYVLMRRGDRDFAGVAGVLSLASVGPIMTTLLYG